MNFKKSILLPLLAILQLGWAQSGGADEVDAYNLLPQIQVDSSGIFLDQIVTLSGGSRILPHIRLARAPHPGQTASLSRNDIASLVASAQTGLLLTNWTGANEIRVTRRMRALDDADVLDLLTTALQKDYVKGGGELEIHFPRPWPKPLVPDEPLTLKVSEMPSCGLCPALVVSFELWDGDKERVGNWQMPVQASLWRDIPVAHSSLLRGQALKDADVTMERADVLVQRDAYPNFPPTDNTLELTENIAPGKPILNRSVRVRPLILRGQVVEAIFQDGALGISLMVETLEDGALGQYVRVRNPKTNRELHGKVENDKTIRIIL